MPITLSCRAFSIAGELNSVIAGLTRAGNETGDLNLLLLQAHVSASTESGATPNAGKNICCTQLPSLHPLLNHPTERFFRLSESRPHYLFKPTQKCLLQEA